MVDEGKNAKEQANSRKKQDQDAVAKGGAANRSRSSGILVTHGATLGDDAGTSKDQAEHAKSCVSDHVSECHGGYFEPSNRSNAKISTHRASRKCQ